MFLIFDFLYYRTLFSAFSIAYYPDIIKVANEYKKSTNPDYDSEFVDTRMLVLFTLRLRMCPQPIAIRQFLDTDLLFHGHCQRFVGQSR